MRCNNFKDYLERYTDKTLSTRKLSAMEEHLKSCVKCRCTLTDSNYTKSLFMELPQPLVPAELTAGIMRSVRNSLSGAEKCNERILTQWWNEARIPVRLAFSVVSLIFIAAGVFMGKDLWSAPVSKAYPEYTELDTFSDSQKGSLEDVYFQLITTPIKGDEK
jgi:predicted anti-sigma-YlaC factor YlaD